MLKIPLKAKHNKTKTTRHIQTSPQKPLISYICFYKEKKALYSQVHPELLNQELAKVLSEKYEQFQEQIKQKYIEDFQKEK